MDRRQQKTRAAVFAALRSLLAEKTYGKISVQEIIDRANIGRSTFYAHFETKDALLHELCTDLFEHVFSRAPASEHTHDFSDGRADARSAVTHILCHLRDDQTGITAILTCESGELFLRYFRTYVDDLLLGRLFAGLDREKLNVPYEFLANHISGSFVNMIVWWLRGGARETPEELADYFLAVVTPLLPAGPEGQNFQPEAAGIGHPAD